MLPSSSNWSAGERIVIRKALVSYYLLYYINIMYVLDLNLKYIDISSLTPSIRDYNGVSFQKAPTNK